MARRRCEVLAGGAMLALVLVMGGCAVRTGETEEAPATVETARLYPGDRVEIAVTGEPHLSGLYDLDRDGRFEMPWIGVVDAYERTPLEVQETVIAALADGFLRAPEVRVVQAAPRPVFVFGEVELPGSYVYREGLTVGNAIEGAGGVLEDVGTVEIVLTPGGRASEARIVDLDAALAPGDVLELRERTG